MCLSVRYRCANKSMYSVYGKQSQELLSMISRASWTEIKTQNRKIKNLNSDLCLCLKPGSSVSLIVVFFLLFLFPWLFMVEHDSLSHCSVCFQKSPM